MSNGLPSQVQFLAAVEAREEEILVEHGFSIEQDDGKLIADYTAMKEKAADIIIAAYAAKKNERAKVGRSRNDLYADVFPDGPGAKNGDESISDIDQLVKEKLIRRLWGVTQTAPNAFTQRRLENGYVLVKARVHRGHDPVQVVYVTDNANLLMEDSLQPEIDGLLQRANRLRLHASMIAERQPALAQRVQRQVSSGTTQASAAARLELPAPEDNGD